jgi:cell division septum initiation protein DivIVA
MTMREDMQYISEVLDELDVIVQDASGVPMRRGLAVVDRSDVLGVLDELRGTLPGELSESESIRRESQALIAAAQEEAERIVQEAHRSAEEKVEHTEVYARAQRRAGEVIDRAERYAQEVASGSEVYQDRVMGQLEGWFQDSLVSVAESRQELSGTPARRPEPEEVEAPPEDDEGEERGWRVSSA